MTLRLCRLTPALALLLIALAGCQADRIEQAPPPAGPDYGRPLPPGMSALRLVVDPGRMPDLAAAYRERSAVLMRALDESLAWFEAPSSRQFFPFEGITHARAKASVAAMKEILASASGPEDFARRVRDRFHVYESIGCDDRGTVLFTGYYAPEFPASRVQTARFSAPLYRRPEDLATDPVSGEPQGRRMPDGSVVPYLSRREIEESGVFAGRELVWLEDRLSAFLIHINGSAKLRLEDGSLLYVGYDGKTDRAYGSLGQAMIREGLVETGEVSVPAIRRLYRTQARRIDELMNENESYVFFTEYAGEKWPAGSLGVRVSPECSLATDKKIFPRGGVVLVDTEIPTFTRGTRPFVRFMLDQDTGGAIRAPGRADIYMGVGETVGMLAGRQHAEGRLFYFFLKPVPAG